MYVNKCIKCGREFETKNPRRVICPDCLYPDKSMMISQPSSDVQAEPKEEQTPQVNSYSAGGQEETPRYYSAGGNDDGQYQRPQRPAFNRYDNNRQQGGYNRNNNRQGGYNNNRYNNNRQQGNRSSYGGGYNNRYDNNRQQGGYNRNDNRQGGYNNRFNNNRRPNNNFNKGPKRPQMRKAPKQLLVTKEQLEQIELLYKAMLPLPNPDCHEIIGEKIGLEPRKVFFGINLVRKKMMLPKLPFPKRKLAISPDQLFAIKNLYEPLLPLPPIGCHKIIAAQLKMDEWRVHVGIGLIRSQMGLERWNEDRTDVPEELKKRSNSDDESKETKKTKKKKTDETSEE